MRPARLLGIRSAVHRSTARACHEERRTGPPTPGRLVVEAVRATGQLPTWDQLSNPWGFKRENLPGTWQRHQPTDKSRSWIRSTKPGGNRLLPPLPPTPPQQPSPMPGRCSWGVDRGRMNADGLSSALLDVKVRSGRDVGFPLLRARCDTPRGTGRIGERSLLAVSQPGLLKAAAPGDTLAELNRLLTMPREVSSAPGSSSLFNRKLGPNGHRC